MSHLIERAVFDATPRCLRSINTIKQPNFWQRNREEIQIGALYAIAIIATLLVI
jgi:hypothetical protein